MFKFLFLIIILVFSFSNINAQEKVKAGYDPALRALYIYDISKLVTWTNQNNLSSIKIGILEKDKAVFNELVKLSANKQIKKKSVEVIHFETVDNIYATQVLFVMKESNYDLDKILQKINGNSTLLMSENYEFHKTMINFKIVNNTRRYEVNEKKIKEANIKLHPAVLAPAVKTKEDWEALYEKTEVLLTEEKKITEKQSVEIDKQKLEIEQQSKKIEQQKIDILTQQQQINNQKDQLRNLGGEISQKQTILNEKIKLLLAQKTELEIQQQNIDKQNIFLSQQKQEIIVQQNKIDSQKAILNIQLEKIQTQNLILSLFIVLLLFMAALGFFIWRGYQIKKAANLLLEEKNIAIMQRNEEIMQQKEEIETQRDEIELQKEEIEAQRDLATGQRDEITHQKQEITDSILYASRIQTAVLPPKEFINKILPHHFFILNKPRDIVSGDYYWMAQRESKTIFAVADCTGHGVPGAFMSMLGVAFLNEIVNKLSNSITANEILNQLREHVMKALHQTGKEGESKDGMDIALCVLDLETKTLEFSGANNPLYLIRPNKNIRTEDLDCVCITNEKYSLLEVKADKMPIGIYVESRSFINHSIQLFENDTIYLFSDGYADQFGGPNDKKFKYKPFKELLITIQDKNMTEQQIILQKTIEDWKMGKHQIDDILVMGIRI